MNRKSVGILWAGASLLGLPGCRDRQEVATHELKESGYEMTPEAFFRAAESDDITAMKALVKGGIPADTRDAAGDTALHAAAAAGMLKSADFLLDKGLPVDAPGAGGRTPLMTAVTKGSPAMVRYLLSQKADPLKKDAEGYKSLMLAVKEGRADMVSELAAYDRGSLDTALLFASLQGKAAVIDQLTSYGASPYARTDDGRTPLMVAAENGNIEAVEMLISVGANRFSMDEDGRIAADMAREAGHEELALRLSEEPGREEFGIEEPIDLGVEMVAQVDAAGSGGVSGGNATALSAGTPPAPRQGGSSGRNAPAPAVLDGAVLQPTVDGATGQETAQASDPAPFTMRAYRQRELPLRVESVSGGTANIRMAGGAVEEVAQGASIPGSSLSIVRLQRRMREQKDSSAGPTEVSVVEVEDTSTGRRRELVSGLASTAHEPVALVEDGSGTRYLAKAGQAFRGADGEEYHVVDVRPNQMVIENRAKGEVITVPLRGPRG